MEQKITLEMSQIAIQEPKIFLSKWYQSHKYLDMRKITIFFTKFLWEKSHIPTYNIHCILVSALSVSADMKNVISVFYRYWLIRKLIVSGFIGINRYKKKLISRTLCDHEKIELYEFWMHEFKLALAERFQVDTMKMSLHVSKFLLFESLIGNQKFISHESVLLKSLLYWVQLSNLEEKILWNVRCYFSRIWFIKI